MVSQQASKSSTDWTRSDESVRITAEVRTAVLREFFEAALPQQRLVSEAERVDRKASGNNGPIVAMTHADLRVSNAVAVQQYVASMVDAFGGNRDMSAVAK